MRFLALMLTLALAAPAFAMEGDLTLPDGAFFGASFNRLVCDSLDEAGIAAPSSFAKNNVKIEKLLADRMLIQFLIAANFSEGDSTCRYSAIFNRGSHNTITRAESKAFALDGSSDCAQGKTELDALLTGKLSFIHTSNPIRFIGIKVKTPSATEVCGETATFVRMVFERVRNNTP
jgi:hypothetical protein